MPWVIATSVRTTRPHRTQHLAGAGISIRPFARSQRRLRHHCEVNVPGLHLQLHVGNPRESVRFPALPLRSVSRPNRGDVNTRNPLPAPISNVPELSPISTPLQVPFKNLPDQSVRPVPNIRKLVSPNARLLLTPRRSSFDYASDRYTGKPSSKLASSSSTYRRLFPDRHARPKRGIRKRRGVGPLLPAAGFAQLRIDALVRARKPLPIEARLSMRPFILRRRGLALRPVPAAGSTFPAYIFETTL